MPISGVDSLFPLADARARAAARPFIDDLRLRPDPRATNAAIAVETVAQYYENFGQNWERAAMIKARHVASDLAAGAALLGLSDFI